MNEPVVYRCTAKPEEHRLLICYPIVMTPGSRTYCYCNAPQELVPITGSIALRLYHQGIDNGRDIVLACLSDDHHASTKSEFDGKGLRAGADLEKGTPVYLSGDFVMPLRVKG